MCHTLNKGSTGERDTAWPRQPAVLGMFPKLMSLLTGGKSLITSTCFCAHLLLGWFIALCEDLQLQLGWALRFVSRSINRTQRPLSALVNSPTTLVFILLASIVVGGVKSLFRAWYIWMRGEATSMEPKDTWRKWNPSLWLMRKFPGHQGPYWGVYTHQFIEYAQQVYEANILNPMLQLGKSRLTEIK